MVLPQQEFTSKGLANAPVAPPVPAGSLIPRAPNRCSCQIPTRKGKHRQAPEGVGTRAGRSTSPAGRSRSRQESGRCLRAWTSVSGGLSRAVRAARSALAGLLGPRGAHRDPCAGPGTVRERAASDPPRSLAPPGRSAGGRTSRASPAQRDSRRQRVAPDFPLSPQTGRAGRPSRPEAP